MKKLFLTMICAVLLTGCISNTPDQVSIQATVDSAVLTAIAPYEAKYSEFVTRDEMEASQTTQNQTMQQYVSDQVERAKEEISNQEKSVEPPAQYAEKGTVVEFNNNQILPTDIPYSFNNESTCVDRFSFVSDMTIPDGMSITPHTNFTKSWYITNSGDCTWNSNYSIVYHSGDNVGKSKTFPILKSGYYIKPGESLVVSADLVAPDRVGSTFSTYWAMKSERGEEFGAGEAKNIFLSSNFRVDNNFVVTQNFGSLTCADNYGYITCGASNLGSGRGVVYFDETPNLENGRFLGNPAIVVGPPNGEENSLTRFEFGPLRFPRGSYFYTNFCCRENTPHCDVQVRLYIREPGYGEKLVQEIREFNDGFMGEWKFKLDDVGIFDQEFTYILEVQANGGADSEDLIMFTNTRIY